MKDLPMHKRYLVGALLVLGLGAVGVIVGRQWLSGSFQRGGPGVGTPLNLRPAPEFALPDPDGGSHSLSDWKGQVVILHFWASWCPPCIDEIPRWLSFAKAMEKVPAKFVAISLDETWPDALKILPKDKISDRVISLLDEKAKVSEEYGSFQFPETYLISPRGEIVTKWVGPQDWNRPEIRTVIERLGGP